MKNARLILFMLTVAFFGILFNTLDIFQSIG
jgi:hypothetical protein